MNTVHPERRCSPRFSTAVEIRVESGSATTVNFSTFGVYFETALPFVPEQEILIVFPFHHTVPGTRAECSAQVLRVDRLPEGYGVAVRYTAVAFDVLAASRQQP